MPVLARAGFNNEGLGRFLYQAPAHDLDLEHHRLDVAREHNVAAAAQDKAGFTAQLGVRQHGMHVGFTGNTHQRVGLGHNVEGVERLKRHVFLD